MTSQKSKRSADLIIEAKKISKSYNNRNVLKAFDFNLREGEVHALFGENGAGKSTFVNILTGISKKDRGKILINGLQQEINNIQDAQTLGFAVIHQELNICPDLSVLDNIFLGRRYPVNIMGKINVSKMVKMVDEIPNTLSIGMDLHTPIHKLSTIQQWKTVVNRALITNPRVIILDEPSSYFNFNDLKELFKCIKQLQDNGTSIIYVTNKMTETFEVADRVTIIKNGTAVGTTQVHKTNAWNIFQMVDGSERRKVEKNQIESSSKTIKSEKIPKIHTFDPEEIEDLQVEGIVGESYAIKQVLAQVKQVANMDATVLIMGETGVGKELIARAIHFQSQRIDKPFIRVHCSALPESLLASELFGHEKGAFTGANERRIGRFELADRGTLFLDEIGEFSQDVQIRLLRVLQTKEFERVGGSETLSSDFRLVAATNRQLKDEIAANRFRKDLYYRLNVFPILIPALRNRKEDIPLLATHFLNEYSKKTKRFYKGISDDDMNRLIQYEWPGNIRELEHTIERGVILSNKDVFVLPEIDVDLSGDTSDQKNDLKMKNVEKNHIIWVLNKTHWKIKGPQGAAELLDMNVSTLRSRMTKYSIKRPGK